MGTMRCPNCNRTLHTLEVSGNLVRGKCTVQVGKSKKIERVGPIIAQSIVKEGSELADLKHVSTYCSYCNWTGPTSQIIIQEESILSGEATEFSITIDGFGVIFILEEEQELARQVFSPYLFTEDVDDGDKFYNVMLESLS